MGVEVDEELDGDKDVEDGVSQVDELANGRARAHCILGLLGELRVDYGDDEVEENEDGGAHLEWSGFEDDTGRVLTALDRGPPLSPLEGGDRQLIDV